MFFVQKSCFFAQKQLVFCNSRHIIDKFADANFYSTDHFLTLQDKYEFTYLKEENKG